MTNTGNSSIIPLSRPHIPASAIKRIEQVLASGHLTEGPVVRELEKSFAAVTQTRHAIAVTSCTTGLELVVRALGIGPGHEVIVPDYTYPATAQAVMLAGATAVIVDCDPRTLNIDYNALQAAITPHTRAIMPVSLFGNPLDWTRLDSIAAKHNLPIIEDAACGFGSSYLGRSTGSFGQAAIFSLHPRKSLTTGEGGMITTSDDNLAELLRSTKRFGLDLNATSRENTQFIRLGTNLKMSDLVAAVGLAQMEEADAIFTRRTKLAKRYQELLTVLENKGLLAWPSTPEGGRHGWQSCCVLLKNRDHVLNTLRAKGIEVQIGTYALHREPLFKNHPLARLHGELAGSLQAYRQTLALPLYHSMTEEEQQTVVNHLIEECK